MEMSWMRNVNYFLGKQERRSVQSHHDESKNNECLKRRFLGLGRRKLLACNL